MNEWIVIEASHSRELQGIRFQDGFKIRVLLNTELSAPEYPIEKKVETSQYEIPKTTKQISKKRYRFIIPATERLADTFSVIRLCDNVVMSRNNGNINSIYDINFTLEQKHDEGAFPVINCNFIVEPIIDKGCEDETDLLPETSFMIKDFLSETSATYINKSGEVGAKYMISPNAGYTLGYGYKVQLVKANGDWEDWTVTDAEFRVTNKIIQQNGSDNKWIWTGSFWFTLMSIAELTNPSGTNIKVTGNAVPDTIVKTEKKLGAGAYSDVSTVSQGTFISDGVTFDAGSIGTWTIKCTCLTNSGIYMYVEKQIILS